MTAAAAGDDPSIDMDDPGAVGDRVRAWARATLDPDAQVGELARLAGHSSATWGVEVRTAGGPRDLVLRVAPGHGGHAAAIVRQLPLLGLLRRSGLPVPAVHDGGLDPTWFGRPYLVMDRLPGATLGDVLADPEPTPSPDRSSLFGQAVEVLAQVHAVDVHAELPGWGDPLPPAETAQRWRRMLRRHGDADSIGTAEHIYERLVADLPPDEHPGIVHGDFYSNNWLFAGPRLSGVLDWEATATGPPAVDVGWLCMMYDPASWDPAYRPDLALSPTPEELVAHYEQVTGAPVAHLRWYRALAGFRLAALTAYFLALHRNGERHDPTWERLAPSAPAMLRSALEHAS